MPALSLPFSARTPAHRILLAGACVCAGLLLVGFLSSAATAQQADDGPLVDIIEVEGVLDAHLASYVEDVLVTAAADEAELVIVRLDAPGSYGDAGQRIAAAIGASEVPVAVWVGPTRARALGGAVLVLFAGHVPSVAPGTLIGAAAPLDLAADASVDADAATLAAAAERAGRDPALARRLAEGTVVVPVPEDLAQEGLPDDARLPRGVEPAAVSVAVEAELAELGLADFLAPALADLLRELDRREVRIATGPAAGAHTLDVDGDRVRVRFNNLGLVRRVLHTVSLPSLAYLLLISGALALVFEVFQPGFGVAGISGVVVAALGTYGIIVLPVSWIGLGLVALGLVLLSVDLALARFGLLTAAGTAAFAAGSFWLFPGPDLLSVPAWVLVTVTVATLIYFVVVLTAVLRAQGGDARASADELVGKTGVVRSMLNPEGHVFVAGQLWRARAPEEAGRVKTGTQVQVVGLDDQLTLEVELVGETAGASADGGGAQAP